MVSAWELVGCLIMLRNEFNLVSPGRDKGADGSIADALHSPSSDHTPDEDSRVLRDHDADTKNEVHALDIDSTGPWPDGKRGDVKGSWFDRKIHEIIAEQKRRWLDPGDMCELHYIIWNRYIYSTSTDWEPRPYTGSSDPHTNHAHFSARYETRAETSKRPWGVAPIREVDVSPEDTQAIAKAVVKQMRTDPEGAVSVLDEQQIVRAMIGSNALLDAIADRVAERLAAPQS